MHPGLIQALAQLMSKVTALNVMTEFDPEWRSPCEQGEPDTQGMISWHPVHREPANVNWTPIEEAIGLQLHADVKTYYSSYYAANIDVTLPRGSLTLLMPWNEEDMQRLQQNLIGHLLMKKRLRQSPTLFIACTDDEDYLISLDNNSGGVYLERVGQAPQELLAPSLTEFLHLILRDGKFS